MITFLKPRLVLLMLLFSSITFASTTPTKNPGKVIVGTYFTNPPFEFINDNKYTGFEFDLMNEIARRLNLQTQYVDTTWENVIQELRDNRYDVIMGAITINNDRAKLINFSIPFMTTTLNIIVNSKKTPIIKDISHLSDVDIAVQAKTTDYDVAVKMKNKGLINNVTVYPFKNFDKMIADLVRGKIVAIMKIYPVEYYYAAKYSELRILQPIPNEPQPLGFGFRKSNPQLRDAFNNEILKMKKDGTYNKIYTKWLK